MKAHPYTIQIKDKEKAAMIGVDRFVYEPHVEIRVGDIIRTEQNGWKLFMIVGTISHDAEADPDRPIATVFVAQEEKTDDQRRARGGPFQAKTPGAWANGYVVLTQEEENAESGCASSPDPCVSVVVLDAEGTTVEKHVIPVFTISEGLKEMNRNSGFIEIRDIFAFGKSGVPHGRRGRKYVLKGGTDE